TTNSPESTTVSPNLILLSSGFPKQQPITSDRTPICCCFAEQKQAQPLTSVRMRQSQIATTTTTTKQQSAITTAETTTSATTTPAPTTCASCSINSSNSSTNPTRSISISSDNHGQIISA